MGHIVLIGLMGSGKTAVGVPLADVLGVRHTDSDPEIEDRTGLRGRELAARDGLEALHALEARHLLEALREPGTIVIGAAASTLDDPACRAAMRDPRHLIVWLKASPEALAERQRPDDHRPGFGPDLVEVIRRQSVSRTPAFEEVADLTLDATNPPETLLAEILAHAGDVR
jgi:shikimate kinase